MARGYDEDMRGQQNIYFMKYLNLIIDNNSDNTDNLYTYESMIEGLKIGDRVKVPFSIGNRECHAFVHSFAKGPDAKIKNYKRIISKDNLSLPTDAIRVIDWMRQRYFCKYIDGVKCFTPVGTEPKRKVKRDIFNGKHLDMLTPPSLTGEQEKAVKDILPYVERREHGVFLLHGVTSSGKTEVYIRIIDECIKKGRTAIMLVPEISLTSQTIQRFIGRFGPEYLAVLHSKLSKGERYNQWMRIKDGHAKLVIGARSAVFAPFENIGAIILDEEHETTYKSDMSPKYDTIEVAIKRGEINRSVVILGSATPSLTSAYRTVKGEYKHISLKKRFNKTPLPSVEIVDLRDELRGGNKSIFSRKLYNMMESCFEEGRQVILFLNRRGYSTFISCRSCGYVVRCDECDISMTYHKKDHMAICHFCGRGIEAPKLCPNCASEYIRYFGVGTEKVEEFTKKTFPGKRVERLDMDTTRRKGSIEAILNRFEKGETDILIGTQLVAKGLDFSNVGLVGIVSADVTLNIPDYRSSERTFQLITQAAGRAGRGLKPGHVVIQSYTPDHYAIQLGAGQSYREFYMAEIKFRESTVYPPFCDILYIVIGDKSEKKAQNVAEDIKESFLAKVGKGHRPYVLGPRAAPVSKAGGMYRYQLFIKCLPANWEKYRDALWLIKKKATREKKREWSLSIDVNPFGFM